MHQSMKFVIAFVKPLQLDEILDALASAGVQELAVTEAKAYGRQTGHREFYRGAEYTPKYVRLLKIELAVSSDQVANLTEVITRASGPGSGAAAELFVFDMERTFGTVMGGPMISLKAA
jgi:nitrogen regulatory protein P-II 2